MRTRTVIFTSHRLPPLAPWRTYWKYFSCFWWNIFDVVPWNMTQRHKWFKENGIEMTRLVIRRSESLETDSYQAELEQTHLEWHFRCWSAASGLVTFWVWLVLVVELVEGDAASPPSQCHLCVSHLPLLPLCILLSKTHNGSFVTLGLASHQCLVGVESNILITSDIPLRTRLLINIFPTK